MIVRRAKRVKDYCMVEMMASVKGFWATMMRRAQLLRNYELGVCCLCKCIYMVKRDVIVGTEELLVKRNTSWMRSSQFLSSLLCITRCTLCHWWSEEVIESIMSCWEQRV